MSSPTSHRTATDVASADIPAQRSVQHDTDWLAARLNTRRAGGEQAAARSVRALA